MQHAEILQLAGLRVDGRRFDELRRMRHKLSVIQTADGSAYLEQGLNKVLVIINGPQEPSRSSSHPTDKGTVAVHISNAAFSGTERRRRRANDKRSVEMESIIRQTVEGFVMLELYPKSEISITLHILESDGSIICSCFNAINFALMDAGISMSDMIVSCSVGYVRGQLCQDLNQNEQNSGGSYMPVVVKARTEEIIHLQLDSRLSLENLEEALETSVNGCRKIRAYAETAIQTYISEVFERTYNI